MVPLVLLMRALKNVVIRFLGKEISCMTLFDMGSEVTAVQRSFFEESFGAKWSTLDKPLRLYWINGESIQADKYAQITIIIDDFNLPETVLVIDNFIKEVEVERRKIRLHESIVGSGTMDKYGITLDPKEVLS